MPDFAKILVANRGEIAIRVMRAANELGKRTVADLRRGGQALACTASRPTRPTASARGWARSPPTSRSRRSCASAKKCGADAIHPGYGLLSENPDFVEACTAAGITFIGPRAETMRQLGDKASARRVAIEAGVPVIPATEVLGDDMEAIRRQAEEIGYPLMLKACWGGGGRGMRPIAEAERAGGRRSARAGARPRPPSATARATSRR